MLHDKIKEAQRVVEATLGTHDRPVLMCSFGKDSMVLLHIVREMGGAKMPVLFHRDPWFARKYEFAEKVTRDWELDVFDYPPLATSLWEGKSIVAFTNHYQVGIDKESKPVVLHLPKNIVQPEEGKKWLCGLNDLLRRPTAYFNYPWDLAFIAHKSSDEDQIAGKVPLSCDVKQNNGAGPDYAFPLRTWSDEDVWGYTKRHAVPVQETRYEKRNGRWTEAEDKTANSDYWHACIRCCDRREPKTVFCPLLKVEVTNISETVEYHDASQEYCNAQG